MKLALFCGEIPDGNGFVLPSENGELLVIGGEGQGINGVGSETQFRNQSAAI